MLRQEKRFDFDVGGFDGPPDPFEGGGGGGGWPKWGIAVAAFLAGFITCNLVILAPMYIPFALGAAVITFTVVAATRRWR